MAPPAASGGVGEKMGKGDGVLGMQMLEMAFEKVLRKTEGKGSGTSRDWGMVVGAMTRGKVSLESQSRERSFYVRSGATLRVPRVELLLEP